MELGLRFKVMCADAGLNTEAVAKVLHVTTRTVQNYFSGRVAIPYAAYRLVRILGRYELPQAGWDGWHMHSGKLWSPEGHGFVPSDSTWWAALCSQARLWRESVQRDRQFAMLMLRAGRIEPGTGSAGAARAPGPDQVWPNVEDGRTAKPSGPNSFLEHFSPQRIEKGLSTEEKPASKSATESVAEISPHEIQGGAA